LKTIKPPINIRIKAGMKVNTGEFVMGPPKNNQKSPIIPKIHPPILDKYAKKSPILFFIF